MNDQPDVTAMWMAVETVLPDGWRLDSLRCASTGLGEGERSPDWRAVAEGPGGETREGQGGDPTTALRDLADSFASAR